jgi:membrane protease YdiL (CAAX protease family)
VGVTAARPIPFLIAAAAGILTLVVGSAPLCAATGSRSIALAGLATGVALACFAAAGSCWTGATLARGLSLERGHLRAREVAALAVGMIGLSNGLDTLAHAHSAYQGSGLQLLEGQLARAPEEAVSALLLVVGLALAPGIGEELFFRGWLLRVAAPLIGRWSAVAVCALLFGMLHGGPLHVLAAVTMGLYLGAVTLASGSVRAALVCHVANNGVAVALGTGWLSGPGSLPSWLWTSASLAAAAGATCWLALRIHSHSHPRALATRA